VLRRLVGLKNCFLIEQNGNKWTTDLPYLIQTKALEVVSNVVASIVLVVLVVVTYSGS
jgi:hypothetical protein